MKKRGAAVCCTILVAGFLGLGSVAAAPNTEDSPARVRDLWGQMPLHFEANRGQSDAEVRFLARGPGYGIYLTGSEAVLQLAPAARTRAGRSTVRPREAVRLRLLGANRRPQVLGADEMPGKANYFIGSDPSRWHAGVPLYGRVLYKDVYPGVSLEYYGNQRQLEYDFTLEPGAELGKIRMRIDGARALRLDAEGNLVVETPHGAMVQKAPVVYQEGRAGRQPLVARYVLRGRREIGFAVDGRDRSARLVIDPIVFVYSTFLGGDDDDAGRSIALDRSRNAYITGGTFSSTLPKDFPQRTIGPVKAGSGDVFVRKLDEFGRLVYSTVIGGSDSDTGLGIAVDEEGNAFVTGWTFSADFPTVGELQPYRGNGDAFVLQLNTAGSLLVYSTYLGGTD